MFCAVFGIFAAMKRREITDILIRAAGDLYPREEARAIAFVVTRHFYGFGRKEAAMDPDADVENYDAIKLKDILSQLGSWKPVQYITGETEFMGLRIGVSGATLIPRPETEELVSAIIKYPRKVRPEKILDIGTGSGAIAIALAKNIPGTQVYAVDVSGEALAVARKNAGANGVEANFIMADVLLPQEELLDLLPPGQFDIIVSNPPYIPEGEKLSMRANVTCHEPAGALFVPDGDPLLFYRTIGSLACKALSNEGELWFEVHEDFAQEVCALMEELGFRDIGLIMDINGKERIARCRKG